MTPRRPDFGSDEIQSGVCETSNIELLSVIVKG